MLKRVPKHLILLKQKNLNIFGAVKVNNVVPNYLVLNLVYEKAVLYHPYYLIYKNHGKRITNLIYADDTLILACPEEQLV